MVWYGYWNGIRNIPSIKNYNFVYILTSPYQCNTLIFVEWKQILPRNKLSYRKLNH